MNRSKFNALRTAWFDGLAKLAREHQELFPLGFIPGVFLNVVPFSPEDQQSDKVSVKPLISPSVPNHVAVAVGELFSRIFQS